MSHRRPKPTKSQERLMRLFREIQDENIREIMIEVVFLEQKHRSAGAKNFPRQAVRDVVDSVARLEEMAADAGGGSHAS